MNNLKAEGNTFFNNKEYVKALESYKNGLDECEKEIDKLKELDKLNEDSGEDTEEEEDEKEENNNEENTFSKTLDLINTEKSVLNSNVCATLCSLERYGTALEYGIECTKLKPKWFKSWYRLTVVLKSLKKYEQALTTIDKSIECLKEENKDVPFILLDLKEQIESKLRKSDNNDDFADSSSTQEIPGMPSIPGMPQGGLGEGMNPFIGELMKNKELQDKMQDPSFKEKMMKNKNNPMALLSDPEVMSLVGKLASNLNMNK